MSNEKRPELSDERIKDVRDFVRSIETRQDQDSSRFYLGETILAALDELALLKEKNIHCGQIADMQALLNTALAAAQTKEEIHTSINTCPYCPEGEGHNEGG